MAEAATSELSDAGWLAFENQLRRYLSGRVEPAVVDDLVGAILLRLVQNVDALLAARRPAAYVQRVARNLLTDHYRHRAVERRALDAAGQDPTVLASDDADPGADSELAQCMLPFIDALPDRYRQALKLVDIEQLPQKEAAARLGLSESGMKSRVQRGRAMLRADLTQCCIFELDRRGGIVEVRPRRSCGG